MRMPENDYVALLPALIASLAACGGGADESPPLDGRLHEDTFALVQIQVRELLEDELVLNVLSDASIQPLWEENRAGFEEESGLALDSLPSMHLAVHARRNGDPGFSFYVESDAPLDLEALAAKTGTLEAYGDEYGEGRMVRLELEVEEAGEYWLRLADWPEDAFAGRLVGSIGETVLDERAAAGDRFGPFELATGASVELRTVGEGEPELLLHHVPPPRDIEGHRVYAFEGDGGHVALEPTLTMFADRTQTLEELLREDGSELHPDVRALFERADWSAPFVSALCLDELPLEGLDELEMLLAYMGVEPGFVGDVLGVCAWARAEGDAVRLSLRVVAEAERDVPELLDHCEGLLAALRRWREFPDELRELAREATPSAEGDQVLVELSISRRELVDLILAW